MKLRGAFKTISGKKWTIQAWYDPSAFKRVSRIFSNYTPRYLVVERKTKMAEADQDQNNTFAPNYDAAVPDRSDLAHLAKIAAKVMIV